MHQNFNSKILFYSGKTKHFSKILQFSLICQIHFYTLGFSGTKMLPMPLYVMKQLPWIQIRWEGSGPSIYSIILALQEDWLGTKDEIGSSNVHLYNSNLHLNLVPQEISWSWHQSCKRIGLGTNTISMSLYLYLSSSI